MEDKLRDTYRKLITANHILHHHGVVDAYGHISVRHPTDSSLYIMCGYMAPALVTSPSDLITYHISTSDPVEQLPHPGYSERFIHSEIYKQFPAVQCVIHSHAKDVLPYVVSGVPLRPVYHMSGFLGTVVPVFDVAPLYDQINTPIEKRDMLINNITLGKGLADRFAAGNEGGGELKHSVVLMRRHGFTCQADSIEKAVYRGIYTKINAKALTDSLAIRKNFEGMGDMVFDGGDLGLTEELTIGSTEMNERFQDKPWKLWVKEVERMGIYVNRLG